ncbi:uncharacterized protein METZ01_LOCUS89355 [marine metagenome]|uniref:VTT domain-containing protein n=1 Tax=marine metagenome TaxID=408172 RepID=A0A381V919_9ZZZZ
MFLSIYNKIKILIVEKVRPFTESKYSNPFIFFICFIEAIIFPFPQEIFMIPMMAANQNKIFQIAFYALLGSFAGAVSAYFIGMYFFDLIGMPIIEFYNFETELNTFSENIKEHGFLYVFVGGFSPIPFKLVTLSSGFLGVSFIVFIIASLFSRAVRFFLIGFIIWKFGSNILKAYEKRFNLYTVLIIFIALLIYLVTKFYS